MDVFFIGIFFGGLMSWVLMMALAERVVGVYTKHLTQNRDTNLRSDLNDADWWKNGGQPPYE